MKKLEITKGEWAAIRGEDNYKKDSLTWGTVKAGEYHVCRIWDDIWGAKDNATLIADAGNTYQACELLPSELLELYRAATEATLAKEKAKQEVIKHRDELREALHGVMELVERLNTTEYSFEEMSISQQALKNSKL